MKNGLIFTDTQFEFIGEGQMSMGSGLELSQRFAYDYSNKSQSIAYRKKGTAKTGSITITFNHSQVTNIFDEIAGYESIAGKVGNLYWNGTDLGKYLVKSVQFSLAVDGIDIVSSAQIGIEIQEGYEKEKKKTTKAAPAEYRVL